MLFGGLDFAGNALAEHDDPEVEEEEDDGSIKMGRVAPQHRSPLAGAPKDPKRKGRGKKGASSRAGSIGPSPKRKSRRGPKVSAAARKGAQADVRAQQLQSTIAKLPTEVDVGEVDPAEDPSGEHSE